MVRCMTTVLQSRANLRFRATVSSTLYILFLQRTPANRFLPCSLRTSSRTAPPTNTRSPASSRTPTTPKPGPNVRTSSPRTLEESRFPPPTTTKLLTAMVATRLRTAQVSLFLALSPSPECTALMVPRLATLRCLTRSTMPLALFRRWHRGLKV